MPTATDSVAGASIMFCKSVRSPCVNPINLSHAACSSSRAALGDAGSASPNLTCTFPVIFAFFRLEVNEIHFGYQLTIPQTAFVPRWLGRQDCIHPGGIV